MAYTKTPTISADQNKSVQLLYQWDSRNDSSGNYDTLLKNALAEALGDKSFNMYKRDGTQIAPLSPAQTQAVIGIYKWTKANSGQDYLIVIAINNIASTATVDIYTGTTLTRLSTTTVSGINTSDLEIEFSEFLFQSGIPNLFFTCNSKLYRIDDSFVVTQITTAAAINISPVFLDGYLFIHDGTRIWNSALNDPTTWPASNFLAADAYPDNILRLARVGPYIVALGTESLQWFYDAANPTGTPLAANVGATKRIGYQGGLAKYGDDVYFVGNSQSSVPMLYKISGLKAEPLASAPFSRMYVNNAVKYQLGNVNGAILTMNGHNCYFVRTASAAFPVGPTVPSPLLGESYMYDLDSGMWSKLGYQATERMLIKTATVPWAHDIGQPQVTYFSILGDTNVYRFSPALYQDNGINFEVKFRTPLLTFDTQRVKFGDRLLVESDQTPATSFAYISTSYDDFKTFSTPRPVDLSQDYRQLYRWGYFRRASFTLTYSDNYPMRFKSLEFDYQLGGA